MESYPIKRKSIPLASPNFLSDLGYSEIDLVVMQEVTGIVPLMVFSAKHEGVRMEVRDGENLQSILSFDDNAVIFRGSLVRVIYDLCQSFKTCLS